MHDFMRVLGLSKRHSAWILLAMISMIVVAGATVFAFNLVRPIYDQILNTSQASDAAVDAPASGIVAALDEVTARAETTLQNWVGGNRLTILALAVLAIVIKNVFVFVGRFSSAHFGLATIRDLRELFFDRLVAQSPGYFHDRSTATLVSRATNDLQYLRETLAERLGDVAQDLVTVPVIVIYLLSLDLRMTVATAAVTPLLFAPVVYLSRRVRDRARQEQESTGEVAVVVDETVRGIRVVQNFGMSAFMADRFGRANQRHFVAGLTARALQAANAPIMEIVGVGAAMVVIAYAALQITAGDMTLGDFSAFVLGAYALYNPLKRLNKFNLVLQQAVVAATRVFEVLDAPVSVRQKRNARTLADQPGSIHFENIGFAYHPHQPVLDGFELEVPQGSKVALVGASGCGKSTVVQLIPRFFDVLEGAVKIGGVDVRELDLASLRSRIGLVTQETLLFNDTVHTNIVCGRSFADDEVIKAARFADVDDFIQRLPDGYRTIIGEAGVKLSGGQRQRLALARALLSDPPVLVLDEATSALDAEGEARIHESLGENDNGRTTLVISHRLATIRRAEIIAVLSDGRISELGTHDQLVEAGGLYRRMIDFQELS
jgi:subfamily B ATP-binding cassette protein MsbA